jgi:hypothetical protein
MAGIAEDAFDALEQRWRVLGEAGLQRHLLNERRDQFWVTGRAAEVARAAEGIKVSRSLLGTANRLRRRLRVHVKKSRLRWQDRSTHAGQACGMRVPWISLTKSRYEKRVAAVSGNPCCYFRWSHTFPRTRSLYRLSVRQAWTTPVPVAPVGLPRSCRWRLMA